MHEVLLVGTAPDGVPWVLPVRENARRRQIPVKGKMLECHLTGMPAIGPTLLERALGLRETGRLSGILAVPTTGEGAFVAESRDDGFEFVTVHHLAEFMPESLAALQSAVFFGISYQHLLRGDDALRNTAGYLQALRENHEERSGALECKVDLSEVLGLMAEVAQQLDAIHEQGQVHADVGPHRILLTAEGPRLDGQPGPAGRRAAAAWQRWAAPEQLAGQAVTGACDQYALGLLLCQLLRGQLYGEEVTYVHIDAEGRAGRAAVIRDPGVHFPKAGASEGLRDVLERSLRFRPEDRFRSAGRFAEALREALARERVGGQARFYLQFGALQERKGQFEWCLQERPW